jgi:gamma-glutamyltranspeptidase/glutathione hydrolase
MRYPAIVRSSLCILAVACILLGDSCSPARPPIKARNGMVVSAESLATAVGVEILKSGGNAIDAAVAVGFALAVTYPEAGNLGGGGFMVIRLANGDVTMIDFREKAPGNATPDMYLDAKGNVIPEKSLVGPLAAGVPGSVAGLLKALETYGTRSRSEVLDPAIRIAGDGMRVSKRQAESFRSYHESFLPFPSTVKAFTRDGEPYGEGDVLRQPELARTLELIRDHGREGFYKGAVADLVVAEMGRSGGIITHDDLAAYEAVERDPVVGSYRGHQIVSASPPSAGGIVLLQMLNILEQFDLKAKGVHSPEALHLIVAAAQRAYADRAQYIGDPDFVRVPVDDLIAREYAMSRAASIDSLVAVSASAVGAGVPLPMDEHHTTHYCVADNQGNVVATTVTINSLYGCKTVVDGAGFFLNNEMDDFTVKPAAANLYDLVGYEVNAIEPGKRMVSSMTPTIVFDGDRPFLIVGARGGSRITTTVAQIIINVIDFGMDIREAVELPRIHNQWRPDTLYYEQALASPGVLTALERMGYVVAPLRGTIGRAEAMMIRDGYFYGGPDPREQGVAMGY